VNETSVNETPVNETPGYDRGGSVADEAQSVYLRFREVFGEPGLRSTTARKRAAKVSGATLPFGEGRDPRGLSSVIDGLTTTLGWTSPLARSELLASWADIVGAETAEHSTPIAIDDGILVAQCDSTAWATQLRLMRTTITTHIVNKYPDAGITSIRFEGPNAPSWKKGPRSIPGRGPRDTYG